MMMKSRCMLLLVAASISFLTSRAPTRVHAFLPSSSSSFPSLQSRIRISSSISRILLQDSTDDSFVDVEFEKVQQQQQTKSSQTAKARASSTSKDDTPIIQDNTTKSPLEKSLLELSLDMDPQWKEARIPFCCCTTTNNNDNNKRFIDCHVAFTVDLDDETTTYGIGVPCDAAVAIVLEEEKGGKVTYINPADEQHEELVEIMATQLQELLGDDIYLRNTPKILTISGNLDKYINTDNWKDELFNETVVSTQDLLDDSDESLDFFYDFMKSELGQEEFQKTMDECHEDGGASVDPEILNLFNVPGLGDQQDDTKGVEEMIQQMITTSEEEISEHESFTKLGEDLDHEGVALKLIGFHFRNNNKSYSLVKLLKPFTIVGKYVKDGDKDDLRFDLLSPEEEKLVIPRLEQICEKDLEQAGLSFQ